MERSNSELKDMARGMLCGRYGLVIGAMLLASLIPSVLLVPFQYLYEGQSQIPLQRVIWIVVNILVYLLQMMFMTGLMHIHLKVAYGLPAKISDIFWICKNRPDRALLGGLLFGLIEMAPFAPALALVYRYHGERRQLAVIILLTIAGAMLSIYFSFQYAFVFAAYADSGSVDTLEAFRISASLMENAKWKLCKMYISFIGWGLLCVATLGIGALWVSPYLSQATINFYLEQKHAFDVKIELRSEMKK